MTPLSPAIPDLATPALTARLQARLDGKTKPLGALGRIESLALQLGALLGTETPRLGELQLVVFAAAGVSERGTPGAAPS